MMMLLHHDSFEHVSLLFFPSANRNLFHREDHNDDAPP